MFSVQDNIQTFMSEREKRIESFDYSDSMEILESESQDQIKEIELAKKPEKSTKSSVESKAIMSDSSSDDEDETDEEEEKQIKQKSQPIKKSPAKSTLKIVKTSTKTTPKKRNAHVEDDQDRKQVRYGQILHEINHKCNHSDSESETEDTEVEVVTDSQTDSHKSESCNIDITADDILSCFKSLKKPETITKHQISARKGRSKFKVENAKDSEQDLNRIINKTDFKLMSVIGQFNKGFIVSQLEQDLFIIDQHASDEKFNFEQLQANTVLNTQPLIIPKRLELSIADELVVKENLDIFEKNGFLFSIDENAAPTNRVSLLTVPTSKNTTFTEKGM
jgi:DNA mismatch repair protein PMS2